MVTIQPRQPKRIFCDLDMKHIHDFEHSVHFIVTAANNAILQYNEINTVTMKIIFSAKHRNIEQKTELLCGINLAFKKTSRLKTGQKLFRRRAPGYI